MCTLGMSIVKVFIDTTTLIGTTYSSGILTVLLSILFSCNKTSVSPYGIGDGGGYAKK